ncbi:MAG: hypothetical protein E6R05_05140 [Candidatus Moraniibacteriota bacterium]|nr:MAG: hypothetical protein E6R05_05140 [Candidatus Moranbacteria bacterium]
MDYPYVWFGLATLVFWAAVFAACRETRRAQLWMSSLGLIGGPMLDFWVYAYDFWRPSQPSIPWGSMFFGFGFLGIVVALTISARGHVLRPEREQTVPRHVKVGILAGLAATILIAGLIGVNSVLATALGLIVGAVAISYTRNDLIHLVWRGMWVSLVAYVLLMAGTLGLASDPATLAKSYSSFYVRNGPFITGALVLFWSAAFGAFVGPLYPWGKNLRLASA